MTLRRRFALAAGAAVALTVVLASLGAYLAVRVSLRAEIDDSLRERVVAVQDRSGNLTAIAPDFELPPIPENGGRFGAIPGLVQVETTDGRIITFPPGSGSLPPHATVDEVADGERGETFRDQDVDGESVRILTAPLGDAGVIQAARPLGEVNRTLRELLVILGLLTAGGIALGAGLGALLSRVSLAPIRRFTERSEAVAGDPDLDQRLPVGVDDELGGLARSFNSMLARLQSSADAQRQLVSDASHELRTPLTSLRMNIELIQDPRLDPTERATLTDDVTAALDRLTGLVDDVVELARRGESEHELEDVPLDELVLEAVERTRLHARAVEFKVEAEPYTVTGAPERVGRALDNLLENAAKWSLSGGIVEVSLQGGELTVRDHGPGFDPADLPHAFDRFYRAPGARSRPGSGLGLAIVKRVVEAHGGQVSARNAPGGGALLTARFNESD